MLFQNITKDIIRTLPYLPFSLMAGFFAALCFFLAGIFRKRKFAVSRLITLFLFFSYLMFILSVTLLDRKSGSDSRGISWSVFGTWFYGTKSKGYVIENLMLFVPYGILGYFLTPLKRARYVVLTAAVLSAVIECMQFVFHSGYAELSDVLMNTAGAALGALVAAAVYAAWKRGRHGGGSGRSELEGKE